MEGVKNILESKTVWACLLSIGAMGLQKYGYSFSAEDQSAVANHILDAVQVGCDVLAVYYRVVATKALVVD